MSSRKLSDLVPDCAARAERVVGACERRGLVILIYCTLRSIEEQAALYRQSRTWAEISLKIASLKNAGFGELAEVLEKVGPSSGPHVTNAGPGESWHNYGEAFDAVPLILGKPVWSYSANAAVWNIYGDAVRAAGLYWAGDWKSFVEYPHAQLRAEGNPLKMFPPDEIKKLLEKKNCLV